jgi:hypothetical protein
MEHYSPRQKKERRKQLLGYAMGAAALLVVAGIGWYVLVESDSKRLDSNLCPAEGGPSSVRVVIVDATDPYNAIQWRNVRNRLLDLKEDVPKHGLLAIFSVTEGLQETLQPEFELCNPGSGDELSIWTSNPELARRKWERSFVAPVDSILSTLNTDEPRRRSPIMEAIQAARARVGTYDTGDRKLLLVSDLMQHTETYSHYGSRPPDFERFESTATEGKLSADLSGWEVEVLYARRRGAESEVQGRRHIDFWDQYFLQSGATLRRVKSIDG